MLTYMNFTICRFQAKILLKSLAVKTLIITHVYQMNPIASDDSIIMQECAILEIITANTNSGL